MAGPTTRYTLKDGSVLKLTEADAKRYRAAGLLAEETAAQPEPEQKAVERAPANKAVKPAATKSE